MFVNEFSAFNELGKAIRFRKNATQFGVLEMYKLGHNNRTNYPELDWKTYDSIFMIWNVKKKFE